MVFGVVSYDCGKRLDTLNDVDRLWPCDGSVGDVFWLVLYVDGEYRLENAEFGEPFSDGY